MKKHCFLAVTLTALSLPALAEPVQYSWLDAKRIREIEHAKTEWPKTRTTLQLFEGSVDNCSGYMANLDNVLETTYNFSVKSEYVVCHALQLAKQYPVQGLSTQPQMGTQLCNGLNLASFPNSWRPSLTTKKAFLAKQRGGKATAKGNGCVYTSKDRHFAVQAVLWVQQGHTQYAWVEVTDEILDGTYRTYDGQWIQRLPGQTLWSYTPDGPKPQS